MDINSLLSPQDSPAQEAPPAHPALASPALQSSSKRAMRQMPSRTPSGLSQQITSSPHLAYQQLPSPSLANVTNGSRPIHSATSTPPLDRPPLHSPRDAHTTPPHLVHRQASTPGMDTLADLASMQQQQQAVRQNSLSSRPSFSLQNLPRTLSGTSATDITMAEVSPKPRSFVTAALDEQQVEYLTQLDKSLADNPLDYYSWVSFIAILHQGLQNHLASADPPNAQSYELLPFLQDAFKVMASKYPLGEQLWLYRLEDEKSLVRSIDDRLSLLELYKQATQDEPFSAKLWLAYGDYSSHLVSCSWEQSPSEQWSEEERQIGREVFTPQLLLDIWQQGADKVKYSLQDSSLVWDRYLQFLQDDLDKNGFNQEKANKVVSIFEERLGQPHATWSNTLSTYISFTSRWDIGNPEDNMEKAVQQNTHIKQQYTNREDFEFRLLQAVQQGDQNAEYHALTRYLKWEKKTMGVYSFHLVNALYERATLRFPVDSTLWQDWVEFLIWQNNRSVDLLSVLERATRHCPWSGSLWSHRMLTMEAERRSFGEIEAVKHSATETGLLEHTDLEEFIKVLIAWCGYLRRKGEEPEATEDDQDIAEVGIRSSLEMVREIGMKKNGRNWPGDPKYRLERIHIKFKTQRGLLDEARQIWDSIVEAQQDCYDFWYRYYIWEMVAWSNQAVRDRSNTGQRLASPSKATAVLERAMKRLHTIDYPEPLIEMYVNHCEQHETVLVVRGAEIERRRAELVVAIRRQREAAAATVSNESNYVADGAGKRKRDDSNQGEVVTKKSKQLEQDAAPQESSAVQAPADRHMSEAPSDTASATQKRDREHTSVIVQRLPQNTTAIQVRKYFTDAGTVRNVTMKPERTSMTAIVEFETPEEAEYALTKEVKGFNGRDITIKRGENTTLYVANYPPTADEKFIREIFGIFGEIISVRFPSLKYDTHRRFCYVQFANADDAIAATQLDGTDVGGLKLIAKISNPNAKKHRDGATAEGREVYLRKLNFRVRKAEIEEAFAKFGRIERVNIPTMVNGNNKGFGFIVYKSKESADAAVAGMNGKDFWGLELEARIASDRAETKPKIKSTIENTASPEAREDTPSVADEAPQGGARTGSVKERSIALLNIPDTVNDARIKAIVGPYDYRKITLMPQHGGAVVEFASVEQAGKAEIALQGRDFEARKLRVGSVKELLAQKGEWKASSNLVKPARVNRPTASRGGARGRGKPGLGHRPAAPRDISSNEDKVEAKTNDDFRAMLLGKRQQKEEQVADNKDRMEE